jgi:hypothetical protein
MRQNQRTGPVELWAGEAITNTAALFVGKIDAELQALGQAVAINLNRNVLGRPRRMRLFLGGHG